MKYRQFLYVSDLADTSSANDVPAIVRTSRARNAVAGITGVLLFDGASFSQYIEGPEAVIAKLVDAIQADPRHKNITVLHDASSSNLRRLPTWALGYVYSEAAFDSVRTLRGEAAVETFLSLTTEMGI
jgi:hypothetical protein